MARTTNKRLLWLTQLAILVAIIIILAFTPLGYLKAGAIEITFITIPVVIGAIVLGPGAGAILGAVFGITSFIQCFGLSAFGGVLLGINPFFTFILCMVPRILMGYLCGLIYKGINKFDRTRIISFIAASLSGAVLNTLFFIIALMLLFGNSSFIIGLQGGRSLLTFLIAFVGINGLIEAGVTFFVGTAVSKPLTIFLKNRI